MVVPPPAVGDVFRVHPAHLVMVRGRKIIKLPSAYRWDKGMLPLEDDQQPENSYYEEISSSDQKSSEIQISQQDDQGSPPSKVRRIAPGSPVPAGPPVAPNKTAPPSGTAPPPTSTGGPPPVGGGAVPENATSTGTHQPTGLPAPVPPLVPATTSTTQPGDYHDEQEGNNTTTRTEGGAPSTSDENNDVAQVASDVHKVVPNKTSSALVVPGSAVPGSAVGSVVPAGPVAPKAPPPGTAPPPTSTGGSPPVGVGGGAGPVPENATSTGTHQPTGLPAPVPPLVPATTSTTQPGDYHDEQEGNKTTTRTVGGAPSTSDENNDVNMKDVNNDVNNDVNKNDALSSVNAGNKGAPGKTKSSLAAQDVKVFENKKFTKNSTSTGTHQPTGSPRTTTANAGKGAPANKMSSEAAAPADVPPGFISGRMREDVVAGARAAQGEKSPKSPRAAQDEKSPKTPRAAQDEKSPKTKSSLAAQDVKVFENKKSTKNSVRASAIAASAVAPRPAKLRRVKPKIAI